MANLTNTTMFKKLNSQAAMYDADNVDFLIKGLSGTYAEKTSVYTKTEADDKFATKEDISSVYHFKGSVETYQDLKALPTAELEIGDTYNVDESGKNYAWTGVTSAYDEGWDVLGGTFDLSNYYTKGQTDGLLSAKVDKVDGMGLSHNDFTDEAEAKVSGAFQTSGGTINGSITMPRFDASFNEHQISIIDRDSYTTTIKGSGFTNSYRGQYGTTYSAGGINNYTSDGTSTTFSFPNVSGQHTLATTDAIDSAISGKVDKVEGMGLSHNDFTDAYVEKLDVIPSGAQENIIETIKVDGAALPVTEKTVEITLSGKVDKVEGMGLSHNDFTDSDVSKLAQAYGFTVSGGFAQGGNHTNKLGIGALSGNFTYMDDIGLHVGYKNSRETQYRDDSIFRSDSYSTYFIGLPTTSGTLALTSDIDSAVSDKADSTAFGSLSGLQTINASAFDVEEIVTKYNTLVTMLSGIAVGLNQ